MRKIALVLIVFISHYTCGSQNNDILGILYDQVEAFNNQDIDKLVENVSEDYKYYYVTSNQLIKEVEGKENFRKSMQSYFGSGIKVTSEIKSYVIEGNRISFREEVSYLNKDNKRVYASSLGVYQIIGGKITRSWYFMD
ncbi:MAG: nuclear transport factor 2 family protein [Bacteroidota bacterium]